MAGKILIINGSAQEPSLNEKFLFFLWDELKKDHGQDLEFVSLRRLGLPLFTGKEMRKEKKSQHWQELMAAADGYIIASPEYYHALPAILKNAFEHLKENEMRNKPVLLLGATDGRFGTVQAQHSLYPIIRTFGAWLVPGEIFIPRADKMLDASGKITDQPTADRLKTQLDIFLKSVTLFTELRQQLDR